MKKFWKRHSLSIVLCAIFFSMIIASWPLGYRMWDGQGDYFTFWLAQTTFSLEADVCGMVMLVLLTKWLKEIGSPTSNDTSEEKRAKAADLIDEAEEMEQR